jgi:hypothetical protein
MPYQREFATKSCIHKNCNLTCTARRSESPAGRINRFFTMPLKNSVAAPWQAR